MAMDQKDVQEWAARQDGGGSDDGSEGEEDGGTDVVAEVAKLVADVKEDLAELLDKASGQEVADDLQTKIDALSSALDELEAEVGVPEKADNEEGDSEDGSADAADDGGGEAA